MTKRNAIIEQNRKASQTLKSKACPDMVYFGPIKGLDVKKLAQQASQPRVMK